MIDERFVFVGLFLAVIGGLSYLIDTIKGKTTPNRVTWFLWALAPLIAFSAQLQQGVGLTALLTFIVGFNPLLIFLASFVNKKAVYKLTKLDLVCGVLSIVGIILWQVTDIGNLAILFSILADALAGVPTIVKSYKNPETESYAIFLLGAINAAITLLTIKVWDFAHYAFPLYILGICILLFSLIRFKLGPKIRKQSREMA